MKVIYVGGGPSALLSSIIYKKNHPNDEVLIIEKNKILGKKLNATGNGRCNVSPIKDNFDAYNNPLFIKNTIKKISLEELIKTFNEIGIYLKRIGEYGYYPISESAPNFTRLLISKINELGIKIILETKVLDYKYEDKIRLITDKGNFTCDKLIFATGGKSSPNLGSDGSLFDVFKNHGYEIKELSPILCPIKIKEDIKKLFGARALSCVTVLDENNNKVYSEVGEVQFKKDALSGIVLFNCSRFIKNKGYKISLNLLNNNEINVTKEILKSAYLNNSDYLYSFLSPIIVEYIKNKTNDFEEQYNLLTNLTFNVSSLYDFDYSHVTRGGISTDEINYNFESKKEKGVYFIGEVLDIDGPCGGYNLRFAFTSGLIIAK